ncbi:hypothetical protein K9N68_37455 (plasmid) [Kovacikia minuta CCNUW1]|nr:hypothetical protein [Kovacikia minuta]UBF29901.1 hypothetical protein K9N68_37455 [Kovacikia minuta CCNUW1]
MIFHYLLNQSDYRNRWISWDEFASLIEASNTSPQAKEIVQAMRSL